MSLTISPPGTVEEICKRLDSIRGGCSHQILGIHLSEGTEGRLESIVNGLARVIPLCPDAPSIDIQRKLIEKLNLLSGDLEKQSNLMPIIRVFGQLKKEQNQRSQLSRDLDLVNRQCVSSGLSQSERNRLENDVYFSFQAILSEIEEHNGYVKNVPATSRLETVMSQSRSLPFDAIEKQKLILEMLLDEHKIVYCNYLMAKGAEFTENLGDIIMIPPSPKEGIENFALHMRLGRIGHLILDLANRVNAAKSFPLKELLELKEIDRLIFSIRKFISKGSVYELSIELFRNQIIKQLAKIFVKFEVFATLTRVSGKLEDLMKINALEAGVLYGGIAPYTYLSYLRINSRFFMLNHPDQAERNKMKRQMMGRLVDAYQGCWKKQNELYVEDKKKLAAKRSLKHIDHKTDLRWQVLRNLPDSLPRFELKSFSQELQRFVDKFKQSIRVADRDGVINAKLPKLKSKPVQVVKEENPLDEEKEGESLVEELSNLELSEGAPSSEFPAEYDYRASRWMTEQLGESGLDSEIFPEYVGLSLEKQREKLCHHGFSSKVDQFYRSGFSGHWVNRTTGHKDQQFVIPAAFKIDGNETRGAIVYCFGEDGLCYHRYFEPMGEEALFERHQKNYFEQADFPQLKDAEAMVRSKKSVHIENDGQDRVEENEFLNTVTIWDARLKITITLFRT